MKLLVVSVLVPLVLGISKPDRALRLEFIAWRDKYKKVYSSSEKLHRAFTNFVKTREETILHNQKYEEGEVSFLRNLNRFADLSLEERDVIRTGVKVPVIESRSITVIPPGFFPPGPPSIDYRVKGLVTPVKDQGYYCSCCWAFSAIAALESHALIKYGRNYTFSEQQLIDCNRHELFGNWGCNGGSQSSAYIYIKNTGIETYETYPYEEDLLHDDIYPCRNNGSNTVIKIKGYLRIRPRDEKTLMDVVAGKGPVAFAFNGGLESFMYYQGGIYDDPMCKSGLGHSSLIVGYGTDTTNGTSIDFWLCKNSWSSSWGEEGYFRMVRGKNMCGMTNYLILPDL